MYKTTRHTSILRALLLIALLAVLPMTTVHAANITVNTTDDELNSDGDCSLREAIAAANANTVIDACPAGSGTVNDTISFNLSGTIILGSTLPNIVDASGLTIDGTGQSVSISGNNAVGVMVVNAGVTLNLINLTVTNGSADVGGGIFNNGGTLTITASTLSNNSAIDGAGIYNHGGQVQLINSNLSSNMADYYGGGIYNNGTLTVMNSTLSSNSTSPYYTGWGGGIYNRGTLIVTHSILADNSANCFGCLGGGILNIGSATIKNSTFAGNVARGGGGIHTYGPVTIANSTFANNRSGIPGFGGAIGSYSGAVTLRNTIIANNPGGNCFANPFTIINGSYNLQFPTSSCGSTIPIADPLLGPLQDNGGPTLTYALLVGSPAINAVPLASCSGVTDDQRGVTRPQGSTCDIGAFEFLVPNQPPAADANGPYSGDEGSSMIVTASGSDPEGGVLSFTWDLDNDGVFETSGQSVTFSAASLDGPSSHTITVQVTDDGGLTATDQATVNVLNAAPAANLTITPDSLFQGRSATLAFSNQSDPSALDTAVGFHYVYDCMNDGIFELEGISEVFYTCAYPTAGSFVARGRIEDKDGGFTDYTVGITVLTPRQGIEGLIEEVSDLVTGGVLNSGQGNALIAKLEAAIRQLDRGNVATAINQLESFVNQVSTLISSSVVPPDKGQLLIDTANGILAALGG